jgi:hypothetical protein
MLRACPLDVVGEPGPLVRTQLVVDLLEIVIIFCALHSPSLVQQHKFRNSCWDTQRRGAVDGVKRKPHLRLIVLYPLAIGRVVEQKLEGWWHVRYADSGGQRALELEHRLRCDEQRTGRDRCPLIVNWGQILPARAPRIDRGLIRSEHTNLDILMLARLSAQPCVNRPSTTKPPATGKLAHEVTYGKEFLQRACRESHRGSVHLRSKDEHSTIEQLGSGYQIRMATSEHGIAAR